MISFRLKRTIKLGLKSLWLHKMRSGLTALGIVFGVASVVAMLAIGEGASEEAQEQIRKLGSQNIIINTIKPPSDNNASTSGNSMVEYGLTYEDLERIQTTIPSVDVVVPVRQIRQDIKNGKYKSDGMIIGTVPWFQDVKKLPIIEGRFLQSVDMHGRWSRCVINEQVAVDLFPLSNPIGRSLKIGADRYSIVGIVNDSSLATSGESKSSRNVFIPITTARSRFGEIIMQATAGSRSFEKVQLHQATVRVKEEGQQVIQTAEAIKALLSRTHKQQDFDLVVPLELLKQAKRSKQIFSIVLGSIAGISLLVGGIGIMNIMLASVTERTREIGIRRALGAKKRDITVQFLSETVLLSGSGGLIGIFLGIVLPMIVSSFADMRTIVTPWSLILAFTISAAVGVIFGSYPAKRAADLDPIEALRHE